MTDLGIGTWLVTVIASIVFFLRGWQTGPLRALFSMLGLLLGGLVGLILGALITAIFSGLTWPSVFLGHTVGLVVAIGCYAGAGLLSMRFSDAFGEAIGEVLDNPDAFTSRLILGISGGLLGLISGLIILWAVLNLFIDSGNVADREMRSGKLPTNWVNQTLVSMRNGIQASPEQDAPPRQAAPKSQP